MVENEKMYQSFTRVHYRGTQSFCVVASEKPEKTSQNEVSAEEA